MKTEEIFIGNGRYSRNPFNLALVIRIGLALWVNLSRILHN